MVEVAGPRVLEVDWRSPPVPSPAGRPASLTLQLATPAAPRVRAREGRVRVQVAWELAMVWVEAGVQLVLLGACPGTMEARCKLVL